MKIIQQLNGVSPFLPWRTITIYYTKKLILKVLIFHSSNLKKGAVCNIDKKAKEDKNVMLISLIWNTNNKVQWVFFSKKNQENLQQYKILTIFGRNLVKGHYLISILNCRNRPTPTQLLILYAASFVLLLYHLY